MADLLAFEEHRVPGSLGVLRNRDWIPFSRETSYNIGRAKAILNWICDGA
jgi:hypothetical protein